MPDTPLLRLTQFYHSFSQRPSDNNIHFWRTFVGKYFAPAGVLRLVVPATKGLNSKGQHGGSSAEDGTATAEQSTGPLEASASMLPRFFQVKFEAGLIEEKLFLGNTQETTVSTGESMVLCHDAVEHAVYDCLRVQRHGRLQVTFTADLRIICWEFSLKSAECCFLHAYVAQEAQVLQQVVESCKADLSKDLKEKDAARAKLATVIEAFSNHQDSLQREAARVAANGYEPALIRFLQCAAALGGLDGKLNATAFSQTKSSSQLWSGRGPTAMEYRSTADMHTSSMPSTQTQVVGRPRAGPSQMSGVRPPATAPRLRPPLRDGEDKLPGSSAQHSAPEPFQEHYPSTELHRGRAPQPGVMLGWPRPGHMVPSSAEELLTARLSFQGSSPQGLYPQQQQQQQQRRNDSGSGRGAVPRSSYSPYHRSQLESLQSASLGRIPNSIPWSQGMTEPRGQPGNHHRRPHDICPTSTQPLSRHAGQLEDQRPAKQSRVSNLQDLHAELLSLTARAPFLHSDQEAFDPFSMFGPEY